MAISRARGIALGFGIGLVLALTGFGIFSFVGARREAALLRTQALPQTQPLPNDTSAGSDEPLQEETPATELLAPQFDLIQKDFDRIYGNRP
jgi:hypothetical protein